MLEGKIKIFVELALAYDQLDLQTPALYKMGWFDRNCPLTKQCCSINYGIAKNRTWGCWLQSANVRYAPMKDLTLF